MPSPHQFFLSLFAIVHFLALTPPTKTFAITTNSSKLLTLINPISTPTNVTQSPQLNNVFNCVPNGWFAPCPSYQDCSDAVLQLPSYVDKGAFHNGPPNDPFQLPVSKTHASCRVRVELAHEGRSREQASWQFVRWKALTLAST